MTKNKIPSLEQLDKRTRSLKKVQKKFESWIEESEENLKNLNDRLPKIESRQDVLMFNLRRVMRHLELRVKSPEKTDGET